MKLQEGKRYVRRDGQLSGVIEHNPFNHDFPFVDMMNRNTYSKNGIRFDKDFKHDSDLVSLHYEPTTLKAGDTIVIEGLNPTITDPTMVVISAKEYNRLKEIEAHLKQVTELWNEIQAEKL